MKRLYLLAVLIVAPSLLKAQELDRFFDEADAFFASYVSAGRVDYASLHEQPKPLNDLVKQLEGVRVDVRNIDEYKAFWINAYNVLVIKGIVNHYPIASPLDTNGFFDRIKYSVGGANLTLNDIENKKLRAVFDDARIHFVLVCGAKGCPPLIASAYRPETLNKQLTRQTRLALNNEQFIRVAKNKVAVSEIFTWYREDFLSAQKTVLDYINTYRNQPISSDSKLEYYSYDWRLNAQK